MGGNHETPINLVRNNCVPMREIEKFKYLIIDTIHVRPTSELTENIIHHATSTTLLKTYHNTVIHSCHICLLKCYINLQYISSVAQTDALHKKQVAADCLTQRLKGRITIFKGDSLFFYRFPKTIKSPPQKKIQKNRVIVKVCEESVTVNHHYITHSKQRWEIRASNYVLVYGVWRKMVSLAAGDSVVRRVHSQTPKHESHAYVFTDERTRAPSTNVNNKCNSSLIYTHTDTGGGD